MRDSEGSSGHGHPLRRLLRYAHADRGQIRLAALYSVLNKVFDLAPPLARFGVTDLGHQLTVLAGGTFLIWVFESLFEYAQAIVWRNLAQKLQHDLRLDGYDHVQNLDLAFFEDRSTGVLLTTLNDDVNQLERFLDNGANQLIQVATTVLSIGTIFFVLAPSVAGYAFLPIPFIILGSFWVQRRIAPRYAAVREHAGDLGGLLANNLSGIATIKSYTARRTGARSASVRRSRR